jgi:hypothetical protein
MSIIYKSRIALKVLAKLERLFVNKIFVPSLTFDERPEVGLLNI